MKKIKIRPVLISFLLIFIFTYVLATIDVPRILLCLCAALALEEIVMRIDG